MASLELTETQMGLWQEQVIYWRSHLDVFIETMFEPIKLTRIQKIIVRQIGNCQQTRLVCSRGFGKTFLAALCACAIAILYPGADQIVTSATTRQAVLMFQKIRQVCNQNQNLMNELALNKTGTAVTINKTGAQCIFKSGSKIQAMAMQNARGQRGKVLWQDESLQVDQQVYNAIANPIKNTTRLICATYGIKDFPSKSICLTSACQKNNLFYDQFMGTLKRMAQGDKDAFACALDYRCAAANGITDLEFFQKEKRRMPQSTFMMEYGSIFLGGAVNSAFPYQLMDATRNLQNVELAQPKNSKSRYVIGLDLATSDAKNSDNTIISVLKFTQTTDGSYPRKLVYMKSYNGKSLDFIADEVRKIYHLRFPNTQKIVFDHRGLGNAFDRFMDKQWVDSTGREYPPLVLDTTTPTSDSIPILRAFDAIQALNQRIYTNMRVALQQKKIQMPIAYRRMQQIQAQKEEKFTMQAKAVYLQTDALVHEMNNVVGKVGASGNVLYDVPKQNMHKDRYSSIAMANDYISQLQKQNIRRKRHTTQCVGVVSNF